MWISAFAAWEAYRANSVAALEGGVIQTGRLEALLDCALSVRDADNPLAIPLPDIPEPGSFPDKDRYPELRAASELALFVSGWAMLHEVRHVQHQQEDTSSTGASKAAQHAEELSCDAFATHFILEDISRYADSTGQSLTLLKRKRKTGIYFALFALVVLAFDQWQESDSHPSLQDRMNALQDLLLDGEIDEAYAIALLAFEGLRAVWPGAPSVQFPPPCNVTEH